MCLELQLRVLYLIDSLAPGGAETSLVKLAPLLAARGIDLEVAFLFDRPGLVGQVQQMGIPVHFVKPARSRVGRVLNFRRLINEVQPALVHTTLFESDLIGRVGAFLGRTRVCSSLVSTSYDTAHFEEFDGRVSRLYLARFADQVTSRLVTRFHAISRTVAEEMGPVLHIRPERIEVVPRGREMNVYIQRTSYDKRVLRRSLELDDDSFVIVCVGRHERPKGLDTVVASMRAVLREIPNARLLLAGAYGSASAQLQSIATDLNVADAIRILGHREDVANLLSAADVFVFPSRREGLGGALIEAMAAGVPVIASDLPVVREVTEFGAGETAFLVPVGDSDSLARTIEFVARNRSQANLRAEVAAAGARQRFDLNRVADQMALFWRSALNSTD